MIKSFVEAVKIINAQKEGIPFEAIEYLQEQPSSKEIIAEIVYSLNHAYDDTYYSEKEKYYYATPLWFAIVAENHLDEKLIDPVIKLFTDTYDDWDFLGEQGMYLLGKLAQKYPDLAMQKVTRAIDKLLIKKSDYPYLYLFEAFYHANIIKYKKWFLKTLDNPNLFWRDNYAIHIADLQIKEAIPIIEKQISKEKDWASLNELKEALKVLKTGKPLFPDQARPYYERRENWKEHYQRVEDRFYENTDENEGKVQQIVKPKKVDRNEPCPCNSGKKYKKCCGR